MLFYDTYYHLLVVRIREAGVRYVTTGPQLLGYVMTNQDCRTIVGPTFMVVHETDYWYHAVSSRCYDLLNN